MTRNRIPQRTQQAARRNKVADPYTMHQDRVNPPVEKYMNGDPSAWAEDQHPIPPAGTPRDAIGLPEHLPNTWDHKDADMWNDGAAYDNADTFDASDDQGRRLEASRRQRRMAALEKKANRCVRIAEFLFPASSDRVIEAQATDLMGLSDRAISATLARLAEECGDEDDKEAAEEEDEKEASRRQAARRSRRAEEDEDDKESKKSRKSKKSEDEDDVEASEDEEDDKESKKSRKSKKAEDDEEDEKEAKKSRKSKKSEDEDEDKEAAEDDEDDVEASDEEDDKESKKSRKSKKSEDEEDEKEAKSKKSKKSEDEDDKESKRKSKKASKADQARELMAQLRNLLAEEDEDGEHEASDSDEDDVEAMLTAMGMEEEAEEGHEDLESFMDEEASLEDMDAEMHRLMNDGGMDSDFDMEADLDDSLLNDLMLEPEVDPLPNLMGDDEDLVLAQLTGRTAKTASKSTKTSKPAPKKSGVKSLGRVTTASAGSKEEDMLSRLWNTDPDVSKVFKR